MVSCENKMAADRDWIGHQVTPGHSFPSPLSKFKSKNKMVRYLNKYDSCQQTMRYSYFLLLSCLILHKKNKYNKSNYYHSFVPRISLPRILFYVDGLGRKRTAATRRFDNPSIKRNTWYMVWFGNFILLRGNPRQP
jgi:hypothetical protein